MKGALSLIVLIASISSLTATPPSLASDDMNQKSDNPQVSTVVAVLTKALESKNSAVGQELGLRTITDIVVNGEIVVPRGATFVGHVTEAITRSKDAPQTLLSVVIDKAVIKEGSEILVQAIIAAVAAPKDSSLSSDPTYGMMHSNEPKMVGSGVSGTSRSGGLSPSSKANSNAAVATAELKGAPNDSLLLDASSQGAIGYEGLSITWQLSSPPPVTVFATKNKNVRLETGTQVLLRLATPRVSR